MIYPDHREHKAVFTVILKPYDPERPYDRIKKILSGNQEVSAVTVHLDFTAGCADFLTLRIPMEFVDIIVEDTKEE